MKAAYINQTGPPEVILWGDLPTPQPGPTECLVKVTAVDVNPIDTYVRSGMVPARAGPQRSSKPLPPQLPVKKLRSTTL